jgi:hypothetical protein
MAQMGTTDGKTGFYKVDDFNFFKIERYLIFDN